MSAADTKVVFSAIKFHSSEKILQKNADGYYNVTLGGFNTFNQSGAFYLADNVEEIIKDKTSILARRIESGYLKGEAGHPEYTPGMSKKDYFLRSMQLELTKISHNIKEISLVQTKDPSGLPGKGNTIRVEGLVKPAGPYGDALAKDLEDPDVNVAFSIRCFTVDTWIGGTLIKEVKQIITWDWVIEPGIKVANKWDKLSLESMDLCSFSLNELMSTGKLPDEVIASLEASDVGNITSELISRISNGRDYSHLKKW